MKKSMLLGLILIASLLTKGQDSWSLSPSVGLNLIPLFQDDAAGTTYKPGLNISVSLIQSINERLSMNYGISVNQRYSAYYIEKESDELYDIIDFVGNPVIDLILENFDLTVYNGTYAYSTLWTFDVPVTLSYTFESGFMCYAGGYVNYLLSASNEFEYEKHVPIFEIIDPEDLSILVPGIEETLPKNETTYSSNNSKKGFNEVDYGLLLGVGYNTNKWMIKLGYQYGLNDIRSDAIKTDFSNYTAIQLSLGYNFNDLFSSSKEKPIYDLELIK